MGPFHLEKRLVRNPRVAELRRWANNMRTRLFLSIALVGWLSACGSPKSALHDIPPAEAVSKARSGPVSGTFLMRVDGSGFSGGRTFLNSKKNFRAADCLTIVILDAISPPSVLVAKPPGPDLVGEWIRVSGTAQQVPIWVDDEGMTHHQVHVVLSNLSQLEVVR